MSPEQCRAARAWLGWSMDDLAKHAAVSNSTIRDFEAGRRFPIPNNLTAMRRALETEGITFIFDGDAGTGIAGPLRMRVEKERPPGKGSPRRPARSVKRGGSPSGRQRKRSGV